MTCPTVADLLAISPRPRNLTTTAIARALNISWPRAAELKRLALRERSPSPWVANLMRELGINRAEAEAYIKLRRAAALRKGAPKK